MLHFTTSNDDNYSHCDWKIIFNCVTVKSTYSFEYHPHPAKLIYLNFHPLEVVSRYRDPQLQVAENYSFLFN